jgi:diacylglycerol O-acyltransferase-1
MRGFDVTLSHQVKSNHKHRDEPRDDSAIVDGRVFPHAPMERESLLNQNKISGFINLLWVLCFMWSFLHCLGTYKRMGSPVDLKLFHELTSDWRTLGILWISVAAYSLILAVTLEFLLTKFSFLYRPVIGIYVISQILLISLPALYSIHYPHGTVLCRIALSLQCFVIGMKFHSYFMFNHYARKKRVNPMNIFQLFFRYHEHLWMPTLIYEEDFPRTKRIHIGAAFVDFGSFVFLMLVLYQILTSFISPVLQNLSDYTLFEASMILMPTTLSIWTIAFFAVFHCFLNGLAEVTQLADREFYLHWWDSTCMSEFWRTWNRPVYKWMARHVYVESMRTVPFQFYDKTAAAIGTQVVTAIFHEYVCACAFTIFRPTFFVIIIAQIPYGMLTEKVKGTRIGNIIMWCGLMAGFPILEFTYGYFYLHSLKNVQ